MQQRVFLKFCPRVDALQIKQVVVVVIPPTASLHDDFLLLLFLLLGYGAQDVLQLVLGDLLAQLARPGQHDEAVLDVGGARFLDHADTAQTVGGLGEEDLGENGLAGLGFANTGVVVRTGPRRVLGSRRGQGAAAERTVASLPASPLRHCRLGRRRSAGGAGPDGPCESAGGQRAVSGGRAVGRGGTSSRSASDIAICGRCGWCWRGARLRYGAHNGRTGEGARRGPALGAPTAGHASKIAQPRVPWLRVARWLAGWLNCAASQHATGTPAAATA